MGMHIFGAYWAHNIKVHLEERGLLKRELHIISANLHSVKNSLFAKEALNSKSKKSFENIVKSLSQDRNGTQNNKVSKFALKHGMSVIKDNTGTNITCLLYTSDAADE